MKDAVVTDGKYTEATASFLGDDRGQRGGDGRVKHGGHLFADQVTRPLNENAGEAGALELPVGHLVEWLLPTELTVRGRVQGGETTADATPRLITTYRRVRAC